MDSVQKRFETLQKQLTKEELKYKSKIQKQKEEIEKNPSDALLWKELATSYDSIGEFTKAIEAHNRAIELSPTNPELWTEKGITFFKKFLRDDEKTHEENALECFNKALEINEKYAPAWAYKGRLLLVISNYEEALKHFDKALELQQKSSYWDGRAFCLFYLKRVEEALASWDKAIELENVVEHWKNKAFAYSSLGKTEEVIKCLEHAVELDSKNEEMLLNLALLYQQTHKQEQAMNAVDKLLMLNPLNTLAHMLKATLLTQQGPHQNIKEAINIMKRALDIDSNDPSLILNYSKILFLDEQYAECCKQLERMFNLGPLTSKKHQQEAIELYQLSKTLSSRIEQQKKQNAELLNTIKERDRTLANIHQSNTKTATTTTTTTTTTDKQNNRDKDQKRSIRNSGKQLENNKQLKKSKRNRKRPSKDPTTTLSTNLLSLTLVATVACVVGFSVWTYFSRRNK